MQDTYPFVGPGEEHAQRHDPQQRTVNDAKHDVRGLKQSVICISLFSPPFTLYALHFAAIFVFVAAK